MRRHHLALLAAPVVAIGVVTTVDADEKNVDISKIKDKLQIVHDGDGHYFAFEPFGTRDGQVFYGTKKSMSLQFAWPYSGAAKRWNRTVWSPAGDRNAGFRYHDGQYAISCVEKVWTPLTEVSAAERKKIIAKAKFRPREWNRYIHVLARDEEANYYLLDSLPNASGRRPESHAVRGVHAYRGPVGRMKKLKVEEFASDEEGFVVVTKSGTLLVNREVVRSKEKITAKWKPPTKRKKTEAKKIELRVLDLLHNRDLVFSTLGVYPERLGTPCDDFKVIQTGD